MNYEISDLVKYEFPRFMKERFEKIIFDCFRERMKQDGLNPDNIDDIMTFNLKYRLPEEKQLKGEN